MFRILDRVTALEDTDMDAQKQVLSEMSQGRCSMRTVAEQLRTYARMGSMSDMVTDMLGRVPKGAQKNMQANKLMQMEPETMRRYVTITDSMTQEGTNASHRLLFQWLDCWFSNEFLVLGFSSFF